MNLLILMIRHGATAGNLEGRYIGRTDEPLLDSSRARLRRMREEGRFPNPDLVYTSPLLRCRETAEILFPHKKATAVRAFAECDFGAFEGKNYAELNGDPAYQAFIDSGGELPFPGGESRAEVEERVVRGFKDILRNCGLGLPPDRPADPSAEPDEEDFRLPGAVDKNVVLSIREGGKKLRFMEFREQAIHAPVLAFVVHGGTVMSILHHYFGGSPFSWKIGCGEGILVSLCSQ